MYPYSYPRNNHFGTHILRLEVTTKLDCGIGVDWFNLFLKNQFETSSVVFKACEVVQVYV